MTLKRIVADWLEHRTGLERAVKNFLYEDIPASGSVMMYFRLLYASPGVRAQLNASSP